MVRDITDYLIENQPDGRPSRTTLVLNVTEDRPILVAEADRTSALPPFAIEAVMDDRRFCVRIRQAGRDLIIKFSRSTSNGKVKATMWATRATRIWLEKEEDRARMKKC